MNDRGNGNPSSGQENKTPPFVKFSKYAAIGLEFPSTILGGLAIGYALDQYFDTSPWFIMTLTLLALVGAFVRLIVMLQRFSGNKR